MTDSTVPQLAPRARITLAAGGWVLIAALVIVASIVIFAFLGPMLGVRPIGDGRDPATYGFDLTHLSVPKDALVASGNPRDFLKSLDRPFFLAGQKVAPRNEAERKKYAVSTDRVIGITVNGETRAYPLQLMNVHEIVNDVLGDVPIAVTYSPLCDSAVVFDRRVGGKCVKFGVSGLLLNSNLVMYELPDPTSGPANDLDQGKSAHVPSLWSQLAFRAIAGPASTTESRLTLMSGTQVCTWAAWLLLHPETTVALPNDSDFRRMKETDYERYWLEGNVDFPVVAIDLTDPSERTIPFAEIAPTVAPLLDTAMDTMVLVIAVQYPSGWKIIPVGMLPKFIDTTTFTADSSTLGVRAMWRVVPDRGALIQQVDSMPVMVPCRWFAWNAFHPTQATITGGFPGLPSP